MFSGTIYHKSPLSKLETMTFPHSDRVVFNKNPLESVTCQLKFPTILEISTERPAKFQNEIRNDYPLFEKEQSGIPKEFEQFIAGLPIPSVAEAVTYKFITREGTRLISLGPEFVAVKDDKYVRWEKFSGEVARAQAALEAIYKPAFYTRIGLRYKDVIDKAKLGIANESWETLLNPSLLGLLSAQDNVGSHVDLIQSEASMLIEEVQDARATIRHGKGRRKSNQSEVYIIDIDFYTTERSNGNDVIEILGRFNRLGGDFFRWAITDRLRALLEPRELRPDD